MISCSKYGSVLAISLSAISLCTEARAVTVKTFSGSFSGDSDTRSIKISFSGNGLYNFTVELDRQTGANLYIDYFINRREFCAPDYRECFRTDTFFVLHDRSYVGNFEYEFKTGPSTFYSPGRISVFSASGIASFNFTADSSPLEYKITKTFVQAVPEPQTWAMLVAGFFSIGIINRRRNRYA